MFIHCTLENTFLNIIGKMFKDTDVSVFLPEFGNSLQEVCNLENEFHHTLQFRRFLLNVVVKEHLCRRGNLHRVFS